MTARHWMKEVLREPTYISELCYTHLVGTYQQVKSMAVYQVETPEAVFEGTVSSLFHLGESRTITQGGVRACSAILS
jgi:hypothetical protein